MHLRLLGPLEVSDQERLPDLGATKQRSLPARLPLNGNAVVSTDRLIAELWGDSPPTTVADASSMVQRGAGVRAEPRSLTGAGA